MIEVEKKFLVESEDIERITKDAEFLGKRINKDIYYDTEDFKLMKQGIYLRERNGAFELKKAIREKGVRDKIDRHEEIENEKGIRDALALAKEGTLEDDLRKNSYVPYGSWKIIRKKYKIKEFSIDIDFVDFNYEVVEIELLVKNESEIKRAGDKITALANELGLVKSPPTGKAMEFLKRKNPDAYREILQAWDEFHKT